MRPLYSLLLYLLTPPLLLAMLWRDRAYWQGLRQRFGFIEPQAEPVIWLHAASVGEVAAAQPVIARLLRDYPGRKLVVSTYTPGGRDMLKQRFGDQVRHVYLPHDLPGAVRRFFARLRPCLGIVMETELWPNLYHRAARLGVPMVLVNARLSAKSSRFYRGLGRGLFRPLLAGVDWIGAQSRADGERLLAAGARPQALEVCGNVKFDVSLPEHTDSLASQLRQLWGGRPVWLAASTHEDEEARLVALLPELQARIPGLLLVLVPRHAARFEAVAAMLGERGLAVVRRSEQRPCAADTEVFLGDSMGELPAYFQAADVTFMGGSLVPVGGHNPLEAAAVGQAVISGPRRHNFREIYDLLVGEEAVVLVDDEQALGEAVLAALRHPQAWRQRGERARQWLQANRGATDRVMTALARYLDRAQ